MSSSIKLNISIFLLTIACSYFLFKYLLHQQQQNCPIHTSEVRTNRTKEQYEQARQILLDFLYEEDHRFDDMKTDEKGFIPIKTIDMEAEDQPPITANYFFNNFLNPSIPVLFKGGAKHWEILQKWTDEYLVEKLGELDITVIAKKDFSHQFALVLDKESQENMQFKDFYAKNMSPERKANYYWQKFGIPKEIYDDLIEPSFVQFLQLSETSIWIGGCGTNTYSHTDGNDNILVQVDGKKRIVLIPHTQGSKLYIGMGNINNVQNYSEVDFFEPDFEKHPLFKDVKGKIMAVTEPGDMLFMPARWWHKVNSDPGRNIMVNYWYQPHIAVDLMEDGIQSRFIPNDHQLDKTMKEYK